MGLIGLVWGAGGVVLLLGSALFRLYPHARELCGIPLERHHWAALLASLLVLGYVKGYKGLHRGFSPRVAARALYLKNNPTLLRVLLAPFFCMGYFHATRKRKIISFAMTAMIVGLILLVRTLEQPWRGIVDAGVVLGLGWGLVSICWFTLQALFGKGFDVSPEVPDA